MDLSKALPKSLPRVLLIPFVIVGLMWSVEVWDWFLSLLFPSQGGVNFLDSFGIRPRKLTGVPGVILAPFLHRDFAHLSANTLPLLGLSMILSLTGMKRFMSATIIIILASGLAVWIFGRREADDGRQLVHLGASGVVFGYLGFLLVIGFIEKRARWIAVSVVLGFLYSGFMYNMLPSDNGVSWESHLFGFLSGILASYLLAQRPFEPTVVAVPNRDTSS
jgi:membrane associated rhomboid family serine protease